ncbi:hypothetical protein BDQ17DRAFT_1425686 [Cyathus striatus]|nr:hypothetical protein BDQ17DRAFT_1425686 [Cyathus striatus]
MPIYILDTGKWNNQMCRACAIQPDPLKAYSGTYMAMTYHPEQQNASITMEFEGIAIYVFFILPNKQKSSITNFSAVNFTIKGEIVGNFSHSPDFSITKILYNQMVFSKTDLPNGMHQLVVSTTLDDMSIFINFDYAIYTQVINETVPMNVLSMFSATSDSPVSGSQSGITLTTNVLSGTLEGVISTGSPTGSDTQKSGSSKSRHTTVSIIGAKIGGIILIGSATTLFVWRKLRKHNNNIGTQTSSRVPWKEASRVQLLFQLVASTDYSHCCTSNKTICVPDEAQCLYSRLETILNDFATMQHAVFHNYFKRLGRSGTTESRPWHASVHKARLRVNAATDNPAEGSAYETDRISRRQQQNIWVEGLLNDPAPGYSL